MTFASRSVKLCGMTMITALECRARQSGNLAAGVSDPLGSWFFRIIGSIVAVASLVMVAFSLIEFVSG